MTTVACGEREVLREVTSVVVGSVGELWVGDGPSSGMSLVLGDVPSSGVSLVDGTIGVLSGRGL